MVVDAEIRPLDVSDIDKVSEIYKKVTKSDKLESERLLMQIDNSLASLGAEKNGELIGFIIGGVLEDAFGTMEKVGLINMIGIDPAFSGEGLGKKLGEEIISHFQGLGIRKIRTIVRDTDESLQRYFSSIGMQKVDWSVFEVNV